MPRKFLILIAPCFLFVSLRYSFSLRDPGSDCNNFQIIIRRGQSGVDILHELKKQSLIRSVSAGKIYLYTHPRDDKNIQAGTHTLSSCDSLSQQIKNLSHGTDDQWITIPEGWRAEQIVDHLIESGFPLNPSLSEDAYQTYAQFEGQLFPDTYLFPQTYNYQQILDHLQTIFKTKTASYSPTSRQLIIASLLEREAKNFEEMQIIAGIIYKRLDNQWPLNIDATLQYIKATPQNWWPIPVPADKQLDSPYNTYLYPGLPPAPICNPGLKAIQAAQNPIDTEYWYYLTGSDGTMYYAKTIKEHQLNYQYL